MSIELVNVSKANVPQSAWSRVKTMSDLVELFSIYGKETPTPEGTKFKKLKRMDIEEIVGKLGNEDLTRPTPTERIGSRYPLVNDDYVRDLVVMA